jgi:hypothetical protein
MLTITELGLEGLLEVGKDFVPQNSSYSGRKENKTIRRYILKRKEIKIPLKRLMARTRALMRKYPKYGYYLERVSLEGRTFWKFSRRFGNGRNIAIFYSSSLERLFVMARDVERNPAQTSAALRYYFSNFGLKYRSETMPIKHMG